MPIGALTADIDVAQVLLAVFFLFFAALVYHLRQEDKREGYPTIDPANGQRRSGFPLPPAPKTFKLLDGGKTMTPHGEPPEKLIARPLHRFPGAPLAATNSPLRDAVGPAAYPQRRDEPLIFGEHKIQVLPMRVLEGWKVFEGATDPRGMAIIAADRKRVGVVRDLWIDRSVKILRYLEAELDQPQRRVLVPIYYTNIKAGRKQIHVKALRSTQFAELPGLREPDRITAREEDRLNAYYAGGAFFGARYVSGFAV